MLADLYLFHYKKKYNTNNNMYLCRYIGDNIIFSGNCLFPVKYPSYLNLTKNILTNNSINFLDLKIILNNQHLCIDIHDKRNDFVFKDNMLTNFSSCKHLSVCKNILLNHMFHIKNLCSAKFKTLI